VSETVIKVESLSKRYRLGELHRGTNSFRDRVSSFFQRRNPGEDPGEIWALKDVSFEVRRGEVLGVIGKNGAGKSTLLKILSRITAPTSGSAWIEGRVGSLLEVGTRFHPELTGRENIYLNGAILGMRRHEIRAKFDEIVAFAEIEKFLDTPVKRYSSGMYVRLAFAVAAHLEPEILLVDEVLAVGDAAFQQKCLGKMGDVSRQGRTILFVSHNLAAVSALCTHAVLLQDGVCADNGDPTEIVERYLSSRTSIGNECNPGYHINEKALATVENMGLTIKSIKLFNPIHPSQGPRTGDPLIIRLEYSAFKNFVAPSFMIRIKDLHGTEIIRLSTMPISGYNIQRLFRNGALELRINLFPLVSGRYLLDLGFARDRVEWLLRMDNLVEFNVTGKDVYGSGHILDRTRGLIISEHEWRHFPLHPEFK